MIVTVLKEHYVLVAAENNKDIRWLDQSGYETVGEEFYQVIFKDFQDFLNEINYLLDYGAIFMDGDDDAPQQVLEDLVLEDFIQINQ